MNIKAFLFANFLALSFFEFSEAQTLKPPTFYSRKGKGVGLVTADSSFSLNFQFRMQNRIGYTSISDYDFSAKSFDFRIRRLRMKFDGFIYSPKVTYYIQLAFSRADTDWRGTDNSTVNSSPNIIADAMVFYNPTENIKLGV